MHAFRIGLVTLGAAWLVVALGREIRLGLRTGSMAYGRRRWQCARSLHPVGFWALAVLFAAMIAAIAVAWWMLVAPSLLQGLATYAPDGRRSSGAGAPGSVSRAHVLLESAHGGSHGMPS